MANSTAQPSISVILVTYNGLPYTRRCLQTLLEHGGNSDIEVIVVDNASQDAAAEKLATEFPTVSVVNSDRNLGFGGGCNLGVARARGEFCALVNNDALVTPNQLTTLLESYRAHSLNGILTAKIIDDEGRTERNCFRDITPGDLLLDSFRLLSSSLAKNTYDVDSIHEQALPVAACSGAFWLFPRQLWHDTGGFDERYFMYFEDIDLCLRARKRGYGCYLNAMVTIRHTAGASSTDPAARARSVDRSQRLFYRIHYGHRGTLCARTFQFLRSAPRAIAHGLLFLSAAQRSQCRTHALLALDAISAA